MNKNALLIVCLALFSAISGYLSAQQLKIGIKAGTSIPNLHDAGRNEISKGYESKVAGNYGIIADIGISKRISIKTGFDYSGQGGIRNGLQPITDVPDEYAQLFALLLQLLPDGSYLYADFNNKVSLNYLEIPVMAKIEWGNKLKYYVNAGPYFGYLLNAEQITAGNSFFYSDKHGTLVTYHGQSLPSVSFDATTDIKDDIKSTNFGLTGGVGLAFGLNDKNTILLDLRASYGLKSVQKDTAVNGDNKTGGLFLTIGYLFSFK